MESTREDATIAISSWGSGVYCESVICLKERGRWLNRTRRCSPSPQRHGSSSSSSLRMACEARSGDVLVGDERGRPEAIVIRRC